MREIVFMWIAAMFGAAVGYVVGRARRRHHDEWPEERVLGAGSEPAMMPPTIKTGNVLPPNINPILNPGGGYQTRDFHKEWAEEFAREHRKHG